MTKFQKDSKYYYCFECLAQYLEVDVEVLFAKLEEFKEDGCQLFQ